MAIVPAGETSLYSALASSELFLRNGLGGPIGGNQQDADDAELQLVSYMCSHTDAVYK